MKPFLIRPRVKKESQAKIARGKRASEAYNLESKSGYFLDDVPAGAAIRPVAKPHQRMGYDYDEVKQLRERRNEAPRKGRRSVLSSASGLSASPEAFDNFPNLPAVPPALAARA